MSSGQVLKIIATDPGAHKDFQAFAKQTGHTLLSAEEGPLGFIFYMQKNTWDADRWIDPLFFSHSGCDI